MGNRVPSIHHITEKNSSVSKGYTYYDDGSLESEVMVEGGYSTKRISIKQYGKNKQLILEHQITGKADCQLFEKFMFEGNCQLHTQVKHKFEKSQAYGDAMPKTSNQNDCPKGDGSFGKSGQSGKSYETIYSVTKGLSYNMPLSLFVILRKK